MIPDEMSKIDVSRKEELCLKCQECCKVMAVLCIYRPFDGAMERFYKTRGCEIVRVNTPYPLAIVVVPLPCPELTPEGCRIYKNRPLWCKMYDGRKDQVMDGKCLWGKEGV